MMWQPIVFALETEGYVVHFPPRDTAQTCSTGLNICVDNRAAIEASDCIHVVWDGKSQGCLFDLGMAFALRKRVIPIQLPSPSAEKSFQNMVAAWGTIDG
jgi:nucleoside 2-deoxyribosyltransferase